MQELTHIDLFSGVGGFALACRWAGIKTVQFVEIDSFCQKVLTKNFPGTPIHDDIRTFTYAKLHGFNLQKQRELHENQESSKTRGNDSETFRFAIYDRRPFLLTGGFPCQPFSCAGKRRGKEDDRFIWPEMVRVIHEAKPYWVIGENVAGIIGMELDHCISDLENEGYEVQTFIIPACAVEAPHRRDRVWIIANNTRSVWDTGITREEQRGMANKNKQENSHASDTEVTELNGCWRTRRGWEGFTNYNNQCDASDTNGTGPQGRDEHGERTRERTSGTSHTEQWSEGWYSVAVRTCSRRVDDGSAKKLHKLETSDRVARLKALGNAIVPQVAYQIISGILEVENILIK